MTRLDRDFMPEFGFPAFVAAMPTDRLDTLNQSIEVVCAMLIAFKMSSYSTLEEGDFVQSLSDDLKDMRSDVDKALARRSEPEDLPF